MLAGLAAGSTKAHEANAVSATPDVRSLLPERHQEVLRQLEERRDRLREERQATVDQRKAEAEKRKLEFQAEARKRLDERQQAVAERVSDNIGRLHDRRCEHYDRYLEHLSLILGKVESRTEKLKSEGKNVASVEAAVAAAEQKIVNAQTAVDGQCAKDYTVALGEGENIGEALQRVIGQLHDDLRALWQGALREAREAVHLAVQELARAHGPTATPSPVI